MHLKLNWQSFTIRVIVFPWIFFRLDIFSSGIITLGYFYDRAFFFLRYFFLESILHRVYTLFFYITLGYIPVYSCQMRVPQSLLRLCSPRRASQLFCRAPITHFFFLNSFFFFFNVPRLFRQWTRGCSIGPRQTVTCSNEKNNYILAAFFRVSCFT